MDNEKMKNMVVLKNLPSNIIEEAIVILKPNKKININCVENLNKKKNKNTLTNDKRLNSKEYIINEAEMVISNYISKIDNQKKNKYQGDKKLQSKYQKMKTALIILVGLLLLSFIK